MAAHFRNTGGARALPINLLGQATRWLSRAEQEDLIERLQLHPRLGGGIFCPEGTSDQASVIELPELADSRQAKAWRVGMDTPTARASLLPLRPGSKDACSAKG